MEILRIRVRLTGEEIIQGHTQRVVMLPFEGDCEGLFFTGRILPGGVDTQRIGADGRCALSARYALEGTDCEGKPCRLFIENTGVSHPQEKMVTRPVIRTDSKALRFLETADLIGSIEVFDDHIQIIISSEDAPHVEHIVIRRGGLTLRGRFEKRAKGPCPLVMLLHGFGGNMWVAPDSWFDRMANDLTNAGCAVLRFDFNGHGCSDGAFREMTVYNEIEDAAAFLQYAMEREDVTDVSLLGHSQGGVVAGMLAGYYHDVIRKLVMLAPAASLKTDAQRGVCMQASYDPDHIPAYVNVDGMHEVGGLYFRMAQTLPIYEVTARFGGRALAVCGGQDIVVSPEDIERYGKAMPNCRVLNMPTLDHGLMGEEHELLMQQVADFLTKP